MSQYETNDSFYPEGDDLIDQIHSRHRFGAIWRMVFLLATISAIVVLTALLYNIVNGAFGLAAVQSEITPDSLVLSIEESRMLGASNVSASEDDSDLVAGIASDPNAVGLFGYAYYQQNSESLRLVNVNGVEPNLESVNRNDYPLARPLFIYTSEEILSAKPQVAAFFDYYLTHVNEVIEEVGYFPVDESTLGEMQTRLREQAGIITEGDPGRVDGPIGIAGSSTVYPLTSRLVEDFQGAGFQGTIDVESVGSTAGLRLFCVDGSIDIANASRPMKQAEREACRAIGRDPVEIRVGTDALAITVSAQNDFVEDLSMEDLNVLFTKAEIWSDVNPSWPDETVIRHIPGADSGTLDFFTETVLERDLADLPKDTLVDILAAHISTGLGRRLERDQRFYDDRLVFENPELFAEVCAGEEPPAGCTLPERDRDNVYQLVVERVVVSQVVHTWSLYDSLFNRSGVLLQAQREFPDAEIEFRAWLTPSFVTSPQSSEPELAGVRTAILGSLWVIATTVLFSFPIGVGAAIYLEEYAIVDNWLSRLVQTNISNLAGVPSIIYGMLGLAIFVRALEGFTSGAAFGAIEDATTANGRTILSAGLTLGLLILPIIIINTQEAIRAVPNSLRQASYGLGATKWQTIWNHVLPGALPGVLTGTILAMSRAIGETAPLVVIGASTFINVDPGGPFSKFTVLPIQIYQWTSRPQDEFRNIAAAAIIVLLALLLTLNATAVLLRNRYSRRAV